MEYHIPERDMPIRGYGTPGEMVPRLRIINFSLAKTHACVNSGVVFCKLTIKLRRNDIGMGVHVKIHLVLAVGMTHVPALDTDHVLGRA